MSVEECAHLLKVKQAASKLICRVGSMKRFDPDLAFARRFIDQEIGEEDVAFSRDFLHRTLAL